MPPAAAAPKPLYRVPCWLGREGMDASRSSKIFFGNLGHRVQFAFLGNTLSSFNFCSLMLRCAVS